MTKNKNKNKKMAWILFIIALIYLISPIDFIPDIIPLIGITDDLIVLILAKVLGDIKR